MLRDAYEESFVNKHVVFEESLYAKTEPLAVAAKKVMSQIAMVGWTSGGHTAGYVPVFAVGAGSKLFVGKMDNTEIPKHSQGWRIQIIDSHHRLHSSHRLEALISSIRD